MICAREGGLHSFDNVVPACIDCNKKKGVKDVADFLMEIGWQPENNA